MNTLTSTPSLQHSFELSFEHTHTFEHEQLPPNTHEKRWYCRLPTYTHLNTVSTFASTLRTGGKVITAVMGIFAVGFFSIPVGILGAGFEEWIGAKDEEDDTEVLPHTNPSK